jgi:acetyl-CoA C-acetyltransferase
VCALTLPERSAGLSRVLFCCDRLGIPDERLDVSGGVIALGPPYAMAGARMRVGTVAHATAW